MNLYSYRMFSMTAIFFMALLSNAVAKNNHCVITTNLIDGNFIASTQDSFLHLSTTIDGEPGKLLYVMPRMESIKDKPQGTFYYAESMTADCATFSMRLYDDKGNSALLVITNTPQITEITCKAAKHCELSFDAIIEWYNKGNYQPTHEKIYLQPASVARLYGLGTHVTAKEAEQVITKTTYAVCSRVLVNEPDFEYSDIFHQCLAGFSGQAYADQHKK